MSRSFQTITQYPPFYRQTTRKSRSGVAYKHIEKADKSPELRKDAAGNRFKMHTNEEGFTYPVIVVRAGALKPHGSLVGMVA